MAIFKTANNKLDGTQNVESMFNIDASEFEGEKIAKYVYPEDLITTGDTGSVKSADSQYGGNYTAFIILSQSKGEVYENTKNVYTEKNVTGSISRRGSDVKKNIDKNPGLVKDMVNGIVGLAAVAVAQPLVSKLPTPAAIAADAVIGVTAGSISEELKLGDFKNPLVEQKSCIILPTPSLNSSYDMDWSSSSLHIIGMGAAFLGSSEVKKVEESFQKLKDSDSFLGKAGALKDTMSNAGDAIAGALKAAGKQALYATEAGRALAFLHGEAVNPRQEQLFNNVNFRSFTFDYIFTPTSLQEAKNVEAIIRQFKYHAHPDYDSKDHHLFVYPSQFMILHIHNGSENLHLPKHAMSVLKRVNVDYGNGGSFVFDGEGRPMIIKMTLEFQEIAILTKQDIIDGY